MTRAPREPTDPEVREALAAVAERMRRSADEMIAGMTASMTSIEHLGDDPVMVELLHSSIEGNITTINHVLANDIPLEHLQPTTAAVEYALRLAQREVPTDSLMRAYRVGEYEYNDLCLRYLAEMDLPSGLALAVTRRILQLSFDYIDWITRYVFQAYEEERRRWIGVEGTAFSSMVNQLLEAAAPEAVDVTGFERETHYRLDRTHLAMIVWSQSPQVTLARVDAAARALASSLHPPGPPIIVASDRHTIWLWVPFGQQVPAVDSAALTGAAALPDGVHAAVGLPAADVGGFQRSHRQAQAAYELATTIGRPGPPIIGYGDPGVAAVSLMTRDLDSTRAWVHELLGPLAADSPGTEVLRETLSEYLARGESHVHTAKAMTLHPNTVKYRIGKAMDALPAHHDRMNLALALAACHYLGPAVLQR